MSTPPVTKRISHGLVDGVGISNTRKFGFSAKIARLSLAYAGAITTSIKILAIALATSALHGLFNATIPPKADCVSASNARLYASSMVAPNATPQGLACLMITQAGVSNSRTQVNAA